MATIADVRRRPHERRDPWWLEPVLIVSVLGGFVIYSLIVSVQNANYFYDPYLSPFYSPCLTTGCIYYRAFFWSPPACAVPDARANYSGETKFPWIVQNIPRYALYLAIPVLAILWWDAIQAFNFGGHFGIGLGTLIMVTNVLLLSGYTFGCHAARYLVGGYLDSFHRKSLRFRLWEFATKLNERHSRWAWFSLFGVALTDLYIRLCATGVIVDPRWVL